MLSSATKNRLSNSIVRQIKTQFEADLSGVLRKEDLLEIVKGENKTQYILRNGVPVFIYKQRYIPTVKCVHMVPEIVKKVVVDKGAVKHLINGADVMAPGLLHPDSNYPNVLEGEIVAIYGHEKNTALAVGEVLMDNEEVQEKKAGAAIKLINHLGDRLYSYSA